MEKQNTVKINDPAVFHRLYGIKKPKVTYYGRDFIDYALMVMLSAAVVGFSYGFGHPMSLIGLPLCAFAIVAFIIRHGAEPGVPLFLRRPREILYIFVYKFRNLKPMYFIAVGALLLENFLISKTPGLP